MTQVWATSSIPDVIESLLACYTSIFAGDKTIGIFDGVPTNLPEKFVVVGGTAEPVADGTQEWAEVGSEAEYEEYGILNTISVYVGGTDVAQKTARDTAFSMFSTIANALKNDIQLLTYGDPLSLGSGWVRATKLLSAQTAPEDEESGKGRRIDLSFTVQVKNRLGLLSGTPTITYVNQSMVLQPPTLSGSAVWNSSGYLTTNSLSTTSGSINYKLTVPAVFRAQADFRMSTTSGADAQWFFFGCSSVPTVETGGGGYLVQRNVPNSQIRIMYAGTQLAAVSYTKDTNFDTLRIDYSSQTFTITYNGLVVLTYTDPTPRTFPGNNVGWGSRSGGTANVFDVKNLSITA